MLSNTSALFLNALCGMTTGNSYGVYSVEDLLSSLPAHADLSKEDLKAELSLLNEREYISIKYQDDTEVCFAVTSKGRQAFENGLKDKLSEGNRRRAYMWYGFLGSAIGGASVTLIFAILRLTGVL